MTTTLLSLREVSPSFAAGRSVHLIEAQALFVPTLADVFVELGLQLSGVSNDVDLHGLLEDQPDVLFIDSDYVAQDPLRLVNLLRTVVPEAIICVYTSERESEWAKACHFAGANAVFSKNAVRGEILSGMRDAIVRRSYTDERLRGD